MSFTPGDSVTVRNVWAGKPNAVIPRTVVRDGHDCAALWLAPGTSCEIMDVPRSERVAALASGQWPMKTVVVSVGVLSITPAGRGFGLEPQFDADRNVIAWYVNLQEPLRRTDSGFDTMDQQLDLIVDRDGTHVREKDRAEFERMVTTGLRSREEADAIEAEAHGAIELITTGTAAQWDGWDPRQGT